MKLMKAVEKHLGPDWGEIIIIVFVAPLIFGSLYAIIIILGGVW